MSSTVSILLPPLALRLLDAASGNMPQAGPLSRAVSSTGGASFRCRIHVKDSEWLADLLRHGLVKASFIPPQPIRELRELARYRKTLVQARAQEVNRLHKVLESANLKLGAVATDVLGASGRDMLT